MPALSVCTDPHPNPLPAGEGKRKGVFFQGQRIKMWHSRPRLWLEGLEKRAV